MSAPKHTPGPWIVDEDQDGLWIDAADGEAAIACAQGDPEAITDRDRADARLIAAAPDLLAALTDLRARHHRALILAGTDPEFADLACAEADKAIERAAGGGL